MDATIDLLTGARILKAELMTPECEAHLARLKAEFTADLDAKYRAGQEEHGGNIWEKPGMLEHAIEEAIDQVVYLYTLRDQMRAKGIKV